MLIRYMASNEKIKKILIILVVAYIAVFFLSFIGGSILNLISPIEDSNSYTSHSSSYSSPSSHSSPSTHYSSSSSNSHYRGVTTDQYDLARNDPGSYYDHYEYGDDYDIDDYLESEGYD